MNLDQLKELFSNSGAKRLYAKTLAENDNSKNQVYFGPDFQALNLFPNEGIVADSSPKNAIFKARIRFLWLDENGAAAIAPGAQLILYPQYPEVRFSGFLKGCAKAPTTLMTKRLKGRVLFLGVADTGDVFGYVVDGDSPVAIELSAAAVSQHFGVFTEVDLPRLPKALDSKVLLLAELKRIYDLGWIDSKQLDMHGVVKQCRAPQCGGFTLEAELGIPKNSIGEPDFCGWEVKQHAVPNFNSLGGAITLMTPEPTGGYYKDNGVEAFVRAYGYADKLGRPDRINFGGIHRVGRRHDTTRLTMELVGYDVGTKKITDADGFVGLVDEQGRYAALWAFSGLLSHWSRKHSKAVYVPSMKRVIPAWQYSYGPIIRLGQGTDPLMLLSSLALGSVYYDPGIKVENASTKPEVKRRSQFRIASKDLHALYQSFETEVL